MTFYKTRKWERKRLAILRRDKYLCRECSRYGRTTPANTVHHIYPLEERPDLALVSENLISLCPKCHERMHDKMTDRLTALGEQWQQRAGEVTPPRSEKERGRQGPAGGNLFQ